MSLYVIIEMILNVHEILVGSLVQHAIPKDEQ